VSYGLYLDGPASAARRWLPRISELGFDSVALCPEDPKRGYIWSGPQITTILADARARGLVARVMDWPRPDRPGDAAAFVSRANAWRAVELDLERTPAIHLLAGWLDEVLEQLDPSVTIDATTFPGRFDHPRTGPVLRRVLRRGGRLHVQAEACATPPGHTQPVSYRDPLLGPGRCQRHAWREAVRLCEEVGVDPVERLTLILASFDQRWPGVEVEQAMGDSYRAVEELGCATTEWWSAKTAMGRATSQIIRGLIEG
jgi:hypothetical protein